LNAKSPFGKPTRKCGVSSCTRQITAGFCLCQSHWCKLPYRTRAAVVTARRTAADRGAAAEREAVSEAEALFVRIAAAKKRKGGNVA
jgi:hypothetical protein